MPHEPGGEHDGPGGVPAHAHHDVGPPAPQDAPATHEGARQEQEVASIVRMPPFPFSPFTSMSSIGYPPAGTTLASRPRAVPAKTTSFCGWRVHRPPPASATPGKSVAARSAARDHHPSRPRTSRTGRPPVRAWLARRRKPPRQAETLSKSAGPGEERHERAASVGHEGQGRDPSSAGAPSPPPGSPAAWHAHESRHAEREVAAERLRDLRGARGSRATRRRRRADQQRHARRAPPPRR